MLAALKKGKGGGGGGGLAGMLGGGGKKKGGGFDMDAMKNAVAERKAKAAEKLREEMAKKERQCALPEVSSAHPATGAQGVLAWKARSNRGALSLRPPPETGEHAVPYLDVMTINSAEQTKEVYGDSPNPNFGAHTTLLVEPVSVPNLEHTGVVPRLIAKPRNPLFYPNGAKNINLRDNIRKTLRTTIYAAQGTKWDRRPKKAAGTPTAAYLKLQAELGPDAQLGGGAGAGGAAGPGASGGGGSRRKKGRRRRRRRRPKDLGASASTGALGSTWGTAGGGGAGGFASLASAAGGAAKGKPALSPKEKERRRKTMLRRQQLVGGSSTRLHNSEAGAVLRDLKAGLARMEACVNL